MNREYLPRLPMISFSIDQSFFPYSFQSDRKLYETLAGFVEHLPPHVVEGMGHTIMRWLYLHAIHRLSPAQSRRLDVPSQLVSLGAGLIIFLAVYLRDRKLDGASLLAGCEAWLVTVRDAQRVAEELRVEAERRASTH
jgi:hypothetical protein